MDKSIRKFCLFLLLHSAIFFSVIAQDSLVVTGKVYSSRNTPIKDVSISIEGFQVQPVLSDENGEFALSVPTGDVWLIVNPIGNYKGKRIFLNNRINISIFLSESDMQSAYDNIDLLSFSEDRKDIITSLTDINLNPSRNQNISSIDMAFQGAVPGLFTTLKSGMPGQGAVSYLRGIKSMNTSNIPLVIIDGMPIENPGLFESSIDGNSFNPLATIDPLDISNIVVLKDPAYTSLYGSKASNGVILIKTLEPNATETSIDFSIQNGINLSPGKLIPQLNSEQYLALANEILASSPIKEELFNEKFPGLYFTNNDKEYFRYMHNTNWQELIFNNSYFTNAHLAVNGGSETATHGLSIGYHDEGGIIKNTHNNRFNVRFISNLNIFSWFRMNVVASLANSNSNLIESAISTETSPILTSLAKAPILNPYKYDDIGQKLTIYDEVDELGISNPLALVETFIGENKNYRFISSFNGQADISKSLKWNTLVGLNFNTMKEYVFMPNLGMETYFFGEADNISQSSNNRIFSFYTDNYLAFHKQIKSVHTLGAIAGFRIQTNSFEFDFGEAKNLPENDQYTNLQSGKGEYRKISGEIGDWNWMSAYNQLSYKYKDKYILNTTTSADFSTRVGKDAQTSFRLFDQPFGFFYSVGAGWRLSEEFLLKNVNGLENLFFRISYGVTGNDGLGNYNALNYYTSVRYRETSGLIPSSLSNTDLKYEEAKQFNLGLDLSLWGDRSTLTINYFLLTSNDIMIYSPQKTYTGSKLKPYNAGEIQNRGAEFIASHRILDLTNFKWDIIPAITLQSNKVLSTDGEDLVTQFAGGSFITRQGYAINSFYGYQYEGIYTTSEEALTAGLVNAKGIPFGAGDSKYADFSGPNKMPDGVINEYDKIPLGSPIPEFFGSFSSNFSYRRWALNFMIHFVFGNEVFNYIRYKNESMVSLSNQSIDVLNRWQYDGHSTEVPRALYNDPLGNSAFSSRWIEDGSYIRFRNLTLSYTIPENFLVFKKASFYITASNIFTISKYLGYDPEFSYSVHTMEQGIDYGLMPQCRQFLAGIRFGL